ncbi:MAG: hypothetical protein KDE54_01510, partial [Caldilineaceae bacterium]|nr:hypothetical protein [Caldilineaceae bacterium]
MLKRHQGWVWGAGVLLLLLLASCTMQVETPDTTVTEAEAAESAAVATTENGIELLPLELPPFDTIGWSTDFTKRIVEWDEIMSGGPPKDGIISVDEPAFESVAAAA